MMAFDWNDPDRAKESRALFRPAPGSYGGRTPCALSPQAIEGVRNPPRVQIRELPIMDALRALCGLEEQATVLKLRNHWAATTKWVAVEGPKQ
jgi:Domain of unknown function (DUF1330)